MSKQLIWEKISEQGRDICAKTEIGEYVIATDHPAVGNSYYLYLPDSSPDDFEEFDLKSDAMDAALEHYNNNRGMNFVEAVDKLMKEDGGPMYFCIWRNKWESKFVNKKHGLMITGNDELAIFNVFDASYIGQLTVEDYLATDWKF